MKNKKEYEEPTAEGAPKEDEVPEDAPESRLDVLEDEVKSISKGMTELSNSVGKVLKFIQKEDEEEDKKPDEEEDKDKKKDIGTEEVSPSPEGGEAKLPDAPAGETDETATPAGDKGPDPVSKSDIQKMVDKAATEKVGEILKNMGLIKSTTPRARHEQDVNKGNSARKTEFALDLLKRAKEGKLSTADMNRETKDFVKKNYEENLAHVLNAEV